MNIFRLIHTFVARAVNTFNNSYALFEIYRDECRANHTTVKGTYKEFVSLCEKINWTEIEHTCLYTDIWFKSEDGKSCLSDAQICLHNKDYYMDYIDFLRAKKFMYKKLSEHLKKTTYINPVVK
jgi:hypothetical protein